MKISVVIPLYNKQKTIGRALDSVFNQTVMPAEVIVVNDGSTDGSEQVVARLSHPLIKLINQSNRGVSSARNRGIAEAKNDWIVFLDADDIWLSQFLLTITMLIEKYPVCNVAATSYFLEDYLGNRSVIKLNHIRFNSEDGIMTNYFQVAAYSHPPLNSSSIAIKKMALESIGGFPAGISSGEDLLTWAKLAFSYKIAYSLRAQSVFILDQAHTYNSKPNRIPQIPDIVGRNLVTLYKARGSEPGLKQYVSHWHKMRASIYLRLGMRWNSFWESFKSLIYHPLNIKVLFYILMLILPTGFVNYIFKKYS